VMAFDVEPVRRRAESPPDDLDGDRPEAPSASAAASDDGNGLADDDPARVDAAQESEVLPLDESPDRSAGALLAGALAAAAAAAVFVWWLLVHR